MGSIRRNACLFSAAYILQCAIRAWLREWLRKWLRQWLRKRHRSSIRIRHKIGYMRGICADHSN